MELVGRNARELLLFHLRLAVFLGLLCAFQSSSNSPKAEELLSVTLVPTAYAWLMLGAFCLCGNVLLGVRAWLRVRKRRRKPPAAVAVDEPPPPLQPQPQPAEAVLLTTKLSLWAHIRAQLSPSSSSPSESEYGALVEDEEEEKADDPHHHRNKKDDAGFRHACGLALFVASYCVNGLFWVPQASFVGAAVIALARQHPPGSAKRRGMWLVLAALGLWVADVVVQEQLPPLHHHLWLGLVVPMLMGGMLVARRTTAAAAPAPAAQRPRFSITDDDEGNAYGVHRYTPDELDDAEDDNPMMMMTMEQPTSAAATRTARRQSILSFAMPALVLLSLTYLSLYFPTQQCMLELVGRVDDNNITNDNNNNNNNNNNLMALLRNATHAYYGLLAPPSRAIGVASFSGAATGFLIAPSLLWLALTILVGSLLRVPSSACSTAAAYVLATIVRRLAAAAGWGHPLLYVALGLAKLGAGCALFDEFMALELLRCDRFQQALRFTDELDPQPAASGAAADTAR